MLMKNNFNNQERISQNAFISFQNQISLSLEEQNLLLSLQNLIPLLQLAQNLNNLQYSSNLSYQNEMMNNKEGSIAQTKESSQEKIKTFIPLKKDSQQIRLQKKLIKKRRRKSQDDEQEYNPLQGQELNNNNKKCSQTKNITKNYGRAIISFIIRNKQLSNSIIEQHGIDLQDFQKTILSFKTKIVTIEGLRSLWLQQSNPYAKVTRIISMFFLRKHSLNYLFYSKVKKHGKNLKYRRNMLEALKNPKQFFLLKEF